MGNLSGESREQNRKDKVTRFRSVTYARLLGLVVNTLGSHLKFSKTLGLASLSKILKTSRVLGYFWILKSQQTQTLVSTKMRAVCPV